MSTSKKKKKKGHRTKPAPPRRSREHVEQFRWSSARGGRVDNVLAHVLWAAMEIVLVCVVVGQLYSAVLTRNEASAFAAAPVCRGQVSATEDCKSWQDVTVTSTSAQQGKGGITYEIAAGAHVVTVSGSDLPGWIGRIKAGQQVDMLIWQDNPEAVRDGSGDVVYTNSAAPQAYLSHMGGVGLAGAGACLVPMVFTFFAGLPRDRRTARFTLNVGLSTAAVTLLTVGGSASLGLVRGLMVAVLVGACFLGLVLLMTRKRRARMQAEVQAQMR